MSRIVYKLWQRAADVTGMDKLRVTSRGWLGLLPLKYYNLGFNLLDGIG